MKSNLKVALLQIWSDMTKIHYRLYFAKWMLRLGRFHYATDPGIWMTFIGGGILTTLIKGLVLDMHNKGTLSFAQAIPMFVLYGILCSAVLYGLWEMVQGIKWLHQWSERYTGVY